MWGRRSVVYEEDMACGRYPVPNLSNTECIYLILVARDRLGILLVY